MGSEGSIHWRCDPSSKSYSLALAVKEFSLQPWVQRSGVAPYSSDLILSYKAKMKPAAFCTPARAYG